MNSTCDQLRFKIYKNVLQMPCPLPEAYGTCLQGHICTYIKGTCYIRNQNMKTLSVKINFFQNSILSTKYLKGQGTMLTQKLKK